MGTGRKFHKKPATRPIKRGSQRRRRDKNQKARLIALGLTEDQAKKLTTKKIRQLLRTPVQTAAALAKLNTTTKP